MDTSLNLKMKTSAQKDISMAITNVDTNALESDLKGFAQGIVSLTTNTLESVTKIDKTELGGVQPTFTLAEKNGGSSNYLTKVDNNHYTISYANLPKDVIVDEHEVELTATAGSTNITSAFVESPITVSYSPITSNVKILPSLNICAPNSCSAIDLYFAHVSGMDDADVQDVKVTVKFPAGSVYGVEYAASFIEFTVV